MCRYLLLALVPILTNVFRTCIHKFSAADLLSTSKLLASGSSNNGLAITALVQSPAIDVVGIGYTSGEISIFDVRASERLMRIFMEGGGIRALGFRTGEFSLETRTRHSLTNLLRWTSHPCICFVCWTCCAVGSERGRAPIAHDSWCA